MTGTALEKLGYGALLAALPLVGVAIFAAPGCSSANRILACGSAALLVYGFGAILNAPVFGRLRNAAVALVCLGLCIATAARMLHVLSETVVATAPRCPFSA